VFSYRIGDIDLLLSHQSKNDFGVQEISGFHCNMEDSFIILRRR
jgi:hypothetical protein